MSNQADLYVETSALLSAMLEGNPEIARALGQATTWVTSRLTFTEARRALRRAQLSGRIDSRRRATLMRELAELQSTFRILAVDEAIHARAEADFPVEHVPTLGALHLASMLIYQQEIGPLTVVSSDARVRANAEALGFEVLPA